MSAKRKARPQLAPHKLPTPKRREAQGAGGEAWWYEDKNGIDVYQHAAHGIVTSARIPWERLIRAAERCGYKAAEAILARLVSAAKREGAIEAHEQDARAGCVYCAGRWVRLFRAEPITGTLAWGKQWVHLNVNHDDDAVDCTRGEVWDALLKLRKEGEEE